MSPFSCLKEEADPPTHASYNHSTICPVLPTHKPRTGSLGIVVCTTAAPRSTPYRLVAQALRAPSANRSFGAGSFLSAQKNFTRSSVQKQSANSTRQAHEQRNASPTLTVYIHVLVTARCDTRLKLRCVLTLYHLVNQVDNMQHPPDRSPISQSLLLPGGSPLPLQDASFSLPE